MARKRKDPSPMNDVDLRHIDRISVNWLEFRGSFIGVPDWATHIAREGCGRIVALCQYPVWDEESGEMRSMLLTPRTPENTSYLILGTDISCIMREGEILDLRKAEFSPVRKSRERNLREGWQTIQICRKVPIWERKSRQHDHN